MLLLKSRRKTKSPTSLNGITSASFLFQEKMSEGQMRWRGTEGEVKIKQRAMYIFSKTIFFAIAILLSFTGSAQNVTKPNVKSPNGFEVNSYTGNLFHSRTDLKVTALQLPLDITFYYNQSRRSKDWGMGPGWTFTYNMAYSVDSVSNIYIERADGKRDLFKKAGSAYTSPTGVFDVLTEYQTRKFKLTSKDNTVWYFDDATHKKLTKVQDRNSNTTGFSYTDSLMTTITDMSNHTYTLTWTSGLLTQIQDNCASPVRQVKYEYDTARNPIKVTNPLSDYVTYYYSNNLMVGYGDERNYKMSMSYTPNNAIEKVISCITTQTFSYAVAQRKTFVTELVSGQKQITTYTFDTTGRVIHKQGNCCGYNVEYQYDNNNDISSVKNGNNQETKYEYDSKGNVIKETDALGNSVTYTYYANNKVKSMTDKKGYTTSYDYDANGNRTKTIKPGNIIENYTYNSTGNISNYKDGNGYTTIYEYNSENYLSKVTDAYNKYVTYTYDCQGNRTSETDARQNPTYYEYNALNQLVKMTDAYGKFTTYHYDKAGNLETVTNPLGKTITYYYDGLNRRIKTKTHMGVTTGTMYDEMGNVSGATDGNSNPISSTYNSRKQVLTETDALGSVTSYDYDEAGNRMSMRDKRGNVTKYEYDELNRLKKQTDALGGIISYSYDANGNRITEMDANGNVTSYEYDSLNRVKTITDPFNKTITYSYDANNNRLSEKDKNDNYTYYFYDSLNRVRQVKDALGGIRKMLYDENGNLLAEYDQLNHATTYTYDKLNRRKTVANAMNETTTYDYDDAGNNKATHEPNGNIVKNVYDDDNRLKDVYDEIDSVGHYEYDANGNVTKQRDGNGNPTRFEYDKLNRRIKQFDALDHATIYSYDANGNLLKETDRNGYPKSYAYDILNRKISETDALNHTTRFSYDANGNRLNIIDAKGNPTSYNYDARNRLTKEIYANGTTREFTYDANGNRKTRKDGNGVVTNYTYDVMNRMTQRSYPDGTTDTYRYDSVGRRKTANNQNATITFVYDNANRMLSEILNNKPTTYSYNTANRTKTLTYPGRRVITEERDKRDRLIAVKEGANFLARFDYDAADRLVKKTFGNGFSENYTYNPNNLLTGLSCQSGNKLNFIYTYDNEGNKLTVSKNHRPIYSEKYIYDSIYQLTEYYTGKLTGDILSDTTGKNTYAYDNLYNRSYSKEDSIYRKYYPNNINAYDSVRNNNSIIQNYTYDTNGNTISDGLKTFSYDYENRLQKVNSINVTVNFYDALGRKTKSIINSLTNYYFFSENNIIEERNISDSIEKLYVYGTWLDDLIMYNYFTEEYFLINNLQGTAITALNASGIVERYEFDAFGKSHIYDSSYSPLYKSAIANDIAFTGRPSIDYQGLYDFRNRVYDMNQGRFLQTDPIGYSDGLNLYNAYFIPNFIDPFGLLCYRERLATPINFDLNLSKFPLPETLKDILAKFIPSAIKFKVFKEDYTCEECCEETKMYEPVTESIYGINFELDKGKKKASIKGFELPFDIKYTINATGTFHGFTSTCSSKNKSNFCITLGLNLGFDANAADLIGAYLFGAVSVRSCITCSQQNCKLETNISPSIRARGYIKGSFFGYEIDYNRDYILYEGGGGFTF